MRKADLGLGLYVLSAIIFLIIPMPSFLLDCLIAINISVALIVLFNTIYAKDTLQMSSFPSVLLLTTIFRIALNASSTRLILTTGNPGKVVMTFGEFVGQADPVVGVVIFIIILIVQFMVINKGSERVAEVTARFTLDAMPGKQMAIDADLNTGAISDEQAKERRDKIQAESAFFGSMDGAVKYVKGDATAGLIITFVNIIGGVLSGVLRGGLDLVDALNQYVVITIGDGLVSSIPSVLISLATGILVTKAAKEDQDMAGMVFGQLFENARVLTIVGGVLIFLGVMTPLPIYIFIPLGIVFIMIGQNTQQKQAIREIQDETSTAEADADEIRRPENVTALLQVDPIELEFGYGIIPLADVSQEIGRASCRERVSINV